ncbi:MAG TPA: hypothetical protein P5572_01385 [Phycisphaerae bacterium]|mgnify:CR=1 FL=1|nr:hypothetical protein [Phycisphaerales bacterium]HRX83651.1 hypothetical protein [Phycisphaerae bacterium]
MAKPTGEPSLGRVLATGVVSWLVPGLGHVINGDRKRGLVLIIVTTATFWGGVAVAGAQSTFKPRERTLWFVAQVCAGGHTIVGISWGQALAAQPGVKYAGFVAEDVAVIYTSVVGLLNVLIIIDALLATDPKYVRVGVRPPPQTRVSEAAS